MATSTRPPGTVASNRLDARFKDAYWCDHKIQVRVVGPEGEQIIRVEKPFARIGSHPSSEVVLPHRSIDRRHLYLHATPEGVFCLVFRGREWTGLRVDSRPEKPLPLKLGPYKLFVQSDPEVASSPERNRNWNARIPSNWERTPILTITSSGKRLGQYPIRRRLISIGGYPTNSICLTSRTVSPFHAVVFWDHDKLWVIDLFSATKTLLHAAEIDAADFDVKAVLEIGRIKLSHSWAVDWQQVVADHKSLWLPASDRTGDRSAQGSVMRESNLTADVRSPEDGDVDSLRAPEPAEYAEIGLQLQTEVSAESESVQGSQSQVAELNVAEHHADYTGSEQLISLDPDSWNDSDRDELAEPIPSAEIQTDQPSPQQPDDNQRIEFAKQLTDAVVILPPDNQTIEDLQRDCHKARARLRKAIDVRNKVTLEIKRLAKTKEALAGSLDKLNRERDAVSQQVADAQAQLIDLQTAADRERQMCTTLRHDRDAIESAAIQRLDELRAALEQRTARIAEEESQLKRSQQALVQDRAKWIQATEQQEAQWSAKQAELVKLMSDIDDQRADLDAEQRRWRETQAHELQHLADRRAESKRLTEETARDLAALKIKRERLETAQAENQDACRRQREQLEQKVGELANREAELEAQRQVLRQDRQTLQQQQDRREADWRLAQAVELQQLADRRAESERRAADVARDFAALKIEREKMERASAESQEFLRLQEENLRQTIDERANRDAELEVQLQALERDRLSLERMMSTEYVQQTVLANMDLLQRENSTLRRLLKRLWPFT